MTEPRQSVSEQLGHLPPLVDRPLRDFSSRCLCLRIGRFEASRVVQQHAGPQLLRLRHELSLQLADLTASVQLQIRR